MDQNWYIWLFASNEEAELDYLSEHFVLSLPDADAHIVKEPEWTKVSIEAMHSVITPIGSPRERMGGIVVQPKIHEEKWEIRCAPFSFPDDMIAFDKLRLLPNGKKYIWLCLNGFEQSEATKYPNPIHTPNSAICCSWLDPKTGHADEEGIKEFSFTLRRFNPLPQDWAGGSFV